jgi:hypothetical protein
MYPIMGMNWKAAFLHRHAGIAPRAIPTQSSGFAPVLPETLRNGYKMPIERRSRARSVQRREWSWPPVGQASLAAAPSPPLQKAERFTERPRGRPRSPRAWNSR